MEAFGRRVETQAQRPAREPMLRAPWPALALVVSILLAYGLQAALLSMESAAARFGVSAGDLAQGRWVGLVTALFVHAGWTHAGLNALAALAFGAPVAALAGGSARGVLVFFGFYLLCGALASLAYVALEPRAVLVGASGAVSGLMGAASRRIPRAGPLAAAGSGVLEGEGRDLLPLTARPVLGMAAGWVAANLLIGFSGMDLGSAGAPVAWQAHLAGYAAGLLLAPAIGPAAGRVRTGRRPPR